MRGFALLMPPAVAFATLAGLFTLASREAVSSRFVDAADLMALRQHAGADGRPVSAAIADGMLRRYLRDHPSVRRDCLTVASGSPDKSLCRWIRTEPRPLVTPDRTGSYAPARPVAVALVQLGRQRQQGLRA